MLKRRSLFVIFCSLFLFSCPQGNILRQGTNTVEQSGSSEGDENSQPNCPIVTIENVINYDDSNEIIYNPDMGFYSVAPIVTVKIEGIANKKSVVDYILKAPSFVQNKIYNIGDTFNLVHLRIDISRFAKRPWHSADSIDSELTQEALNDISQIFHALKQAEKTAIIRFAYDDEFRGDLTTPKVCEPENFEMILHHIRQLCPILKNHAEVISAIECGMIGPWGEMHSSVYATENHISQIINEWLLQLDGTDLPLLVRQPKFIYDYLKKYCAVQYTSGTVPNYIPSFNSKEYRLGLYNDGYLGTESDAGTFLVDRKAEINFLKNFTNHTPYGGELIGTYGLESPYESILEMNDCIFRI